MEGYQGQPGTLRSRTLPDPLPSQLMTPPIASTSCRGSQGQSRTPFPRTSHSFHLIGRGGGGVTGGLGAAWVSRSPPGRPSPLPPHDPHPPASPCPIASSSCKSIGVRVCPGPPQYLSGTLPLPHKVPPPPGESMQWVRARLGSPNAPPQEPHRPPQEPHGPPQLHSAVPHQLHPSADLGTHP